MDVKCERCNTEYEFDDALVSGRGTTVKCTNCGHKFKIRRGDGELADDYWNVTTGDGRTLVFTSLRELQRAIQGYLVERTDRLSRGGLPPKPIGQIPELSPFFEQREATKKGQSPASNPQGRSVRTQDGLGPAQAAAVAQTPARPRQATRPDFPPPSSPIGESIGDEQAGEKGKSTLIGTGPLSDQEAIPRPGPAALPPPRPKSTPPPVPAGRAPMHTQPMQRPSVPSMPAVTPGSKPPPLPDKTKSAPPPVKQASAAPPPAAPHKSEAPPPRKSEAPPTPPPRTPEAPARERTSEAPAREPRKSAAPPAKAEPARPRSLLAEIEDERRGRAGYESVPEIAAAPARRPVGGFVVAAIVLGGALTMAAFWAQKNLGGLSGKPTVTAPTVDPRVAELLVGGEKALSDGNLDLAKTQFDKASALAEKDPHVLLSMARLAAVRADVPWLKQRLLAPEAADEQRVVKNEVSELAAAARKAADDALAVAPDDPAALRAKIDALRIADDRDGARALVPKINASQSQPESAYVLAALDLAEAEPLWSTLIERLKTASSVETGPGRARAALVYALARSGDAVGAKAEVERLAAMPRPHPLLPLLRAYAEKAKPKSDAGAEPDASAKPGPKVATATSSGGGGGGGGVPSDPREMLVQADKARSKGDYERARTLYNAAIAKNPNDSEAIAGLAAIAYAQRDLNGARTEYKRVLGINPNYMPALIGLADVEWDSGNHDGAAKMYKEIVDRYPEGAYPARAKQRSEGSGG